MEELDVQMSAGIKIPTLEELFEILNGTRDELVRLADLIINPGEQLDKVHDIAEEMRCAVKGCFALMKVCCGHYPDNRGEITKAVRDALTPFMEYCRTLYIDRLHPECSRYEPVVRDPHLGSRLQGGGSMTGEVGKDLLCRPFMSAHIGIAASHEEDGNFAEMLPLLRDAKKLGGDIEYIDTAIEQVESRLAS